jgi:hypothetical protein
MMLTTSSIAPLTEALYTHLQASLHLLQVFLTLEWTVFSRLTFGILALAFVYLLALVFSLRNDRQPLVIWEKLGKPVIKPLRPRVFAFLLGHTDPYAKSIGKESSSSYE